MNRIKTVTRIGEAQKLVVSMTCTVCGLSENCRNESARQTMRVLRLDWNFSSESSEELEIPIHDKCLGRVLERAGVNLSSTIRESQGFPKCTHTETLEEMELVNGFLIKVGSEAPDEAAEDEGGELGIYNSIAPWGIYQHFKGGLYKVYDGWVPTPSGEVMVVYEELYGESKFWARPARDFLGTKNVNGIETPRFKPVDRRT